VEPTLRDHSARLPTKSPKNRPVDALEGISHVTITRFGKFLTDTILEAHRLNSPYILENKGDPSLAAKLREDLGAFEDGPINRRAFASVLLKYDVGSLIHGVFLAKKELAGGRLRLTRALSAFIEGSGVRTAASGGVKNDHVNPQGDTKEGFGNVPFARDEFTAESIECHINLDLAQIRGYGFDEPITDLLVGLSLYRVRKLLHGDLRLRTACDFEVIEPAIVATHPSGFALPSLGDLEIAVRDSIARCKDAMKVETVKFDQELKKGKDKKEDDNEEEAEG
jgi:CRISPR-associated protein Csb1